MSHVSLFSPPKTHRLTSQGQTWEIQDEKYTCGPVAIINALHYFRRCVGTATRRTIKKCLNTLPKHSDGFEGTHPDYFNEGLVRYFSQSGGGAVKIKRYVGSTTCRKVFDDKTCRAFIILYGLQKKTSSKYYYHYIFGCRNNNNIITYNDGSDSPFISSIDFAKSEYCLDVVDKQGNQYPQIWGFYC